MKLIGQDFIIPVEQIFPIQIILRQDTLKIQIIEGSKLRTSVLAARDETHNPPLLTRLGSTGLVKKANMVGEDDLVSEYLMSRLSREYVIFHDKTQ